MKFTHVSAVALLAVGLATAASADVSATPGIAGPLKALGRELTPEMVGGTMKLYGPLHAQETNEGLKVTTDIAYGDAARQLLDVYAPEGADGSQPVMIFVHGGGFVRGDKSGAANIGRWFAKHGIVTIPISYRFAPDSTWPSGPEDLSAAIGWVTAHAAEFGGDPSRVILVGNSAGSMHVADYVFRDAFQRADDGVIGAVLISTPSVNLQDHPLDPNRDALYYGAEGDRAAQSVVNAVADPANTRHIPVMIAYAQDEPDIVMDQTHQLIEAVSARDGRMPIVVGVPGHNHISIVEHIGTADDSLVTDMLGFVHALTAE